MQEHLTMGHMQQVAEENGPYIMYYLPHHHPENKTTPLCVDLIASSETTSGELLNSIRMDGGIIQELFSIPFRFRTYMYGITENIRKMFRIISIDEWQRYLLRFLFKNNINDPVKSYRPSTVTYDITSVLYLATRSLKQLVIYDGYKYPLAAEVLKSASTWVMY